MRRLLPLAVALLSLSACRTGGRRGAPTPTADSGPVVTADDGGSLGAVRTDRLAIVPNLVGLNERDAAAFAQRAGFDVVPLVVPGQPAGVVLSQERVAGREAPAGTPIGIRVASGRGVASAPFSRASRPYVPAAPPVPATPAPSPLPTASPTPADMTTPRPDGPAVAAGETPFVTPTDRGVVVPPVLDRTPEQARRIVEDAGLRYREEVASGGIPGRVMDQDPPAGARRPAGTEIVVRIPVSPPPPPPAPPSDATSAVPSGDTPATPPVAVAPAKVVLPSVLDKTEAVARRILEDLGLRVRGEPTASGVAGRVMDQLPSPGTSVDAGSSVVIRIPGLAVADPVETPKSDDAAPIPATEFGTPDAAPSTAVTPPAPPAPPASPSPTPEVPAVPTPDVPAVPPAPPVAVSPPIVAPPLSEPAPVAPAVPSVEPSPAVPPAVPPVPPAPPIAATPPTVEPEPTPTEPESAEPIFASPRRGTTAPPADEAPSPPAVVDGDTLPPPPPPPPAVPAPPPPAAEPVVIAPEAPAVAAPAAAPAPAATPAPAVPAAPPENDAGSAIPPAPAAPAAPPPAPPVVPDVPAAAPAPPVDPSALPVPTMRAPLDGAFFKLAPRVVVEATWNAVSGATGYLLEVEEVTDGVWAAVERRVVKGTKAVVDLETAGGKATDFRWRVRTVVGRRGGKPAAWAVFHAR